MANLISEWLTIYLLVRMSFPFWASNLADRIGLGEKRVKQIMERSLSQIPAVYPDT
jgi:hypothetical protein